MNKDSQHALPKWILLKKFCDLVGYSKHAFYAKKQRGIWVKGIHWKYAPDGHIVINWQEIEKWVEAGPDMKYGATASALRSNIEA